jgi:ADP-heptose:LPS heptosyltransferase
MRKIILFFKYVLLFKLALLSRVLLFFKRQPRKIEKVLIIQLAKLGDMVCTTPLFRAVKQNYPRASLTVIGNALNEELLSGNTDVDQYVVFEGFSNTLKQIRQGHFDVGIVVTPGFLQLGLLCLTPIQKIITPRVVDRKSPYESLFYKMLSSFVTKVPHHFFGYAPREYLRLLEPIGIESLDTAKHLAFSEGAKQKVDKFLSQHNSSAKPLVVMSPSAGNKIKQWPAERFAELAEKLKSTHGAHIVVIGTQRDEVEVKTMFSSLQNNTDITNTLSQFSIDELKALVARTDLFISADTGPIYIAEAFGVPTVDIIGPVDERVQPPRGETHMVVYDKDRKNAELFIMDARTFDPVEARRQVEVISVGEVYNASEFLLKK